MDIRYVCSDEDRLTNAVLVEVSERAAAEGIALAGTVQPFDPARSQARCDIVLRLLPDGAQRPISVDLGPGVAGCRLDPGALEQAVLEVEARLPLARALVVNKFGKQEAAGRGLVTAIGQACERGLPVLVGVSPEWRAAFLDFAGGAAQPLAPDAGQVLHWLRSACATTAA